MTRSDELLDLEVELLLTAVDRHYGYDFRNYARPSLLRRIQRALQEEGVRSISALQDIVLRDPEALSRFISCLSVPVTSMFRDPAFFRALRARVIPMLRTYPFVRVWHAGCSTGEEAYSLAMMLHEEGLYERCRIYATDLSDALLRRARRGVYSLRLMRQYTTSYLAAGGRASFAGYFTADDQHARVKEWLRKNIIFSQHNLVSDGSFNEFHLILCRNVMIYFDRSLRERVHELLFQSLGMFGVLGLGMRESIDFTGRASCYEPLDRDLRLYRRTR